MQSSTLSTNSEASEQQALVADVRELLLVKFSIQIESPEADLFQKGIFDSMTLVQFICQLEERFGLRLPMEHLELDSFVSILKIAELVARRNGNQNGN